MYIFKNAWRNITRNKGRNILIGIIVLVISAACTITLAIKNTSNDLINAYKDSSSVEATISVNRGNMKKDFDFTNEEGMDDMKEAFSSIESLSIDEIKDYADSSYVKSYYYTSSIGLEGNDIEKVSSSFSFGRPQDNNNDANTSATKEDNTAKISIPDDKGNSTSFTLTGYSDINSMTEFIEGKYKITDKTDDAWDLVFNGYNCMINKELADLNEIEVGDTIELSDPSDDTITYSFKVVGIFEENDDTNQDMFASSANTIITNSEVITTMSSENDNLTSKLTPTFVLTSYDDTTKFQDELYEKGMNEYYSVSTNESEVENATSGISNVSTFATTFLIITLVIGAIVLFIINQINVRERKYEIGVLRTIGMKKSTLTLQFITEILMVTLIALLLGIGAGATLSKPISNKLLSSEISTSSSKQEDINNNFGNKGNMPNNMPSKGIVSIQAYDSIDAVVNIKVVLELLLIGIGLTLISGAAATISIQRFSPLEILKERG